MPHAPLFQLDRDLWVVDRPQSFFGLELGTRMSVVRLRSGRLWLHSPVALDPQLRAELDALGLVAFAVAPNRLHHLYAGGVKQSYPQSRLWVAPGLETKRSDLAIESVLGDDAPEPWRGEIDQVFSRGRPFENEVVFFHRATRTLMVCDLAFHIGPSAPAPTRLLMRALRAYRRLGPTALDRFLVRDFAAARESLERILAWDFDRVVVTHGDVVETGGKEKLRAGYGWLLRR